MTQDVREAMRGFHDGPSYADVYAERFRPAFNWYTVRKPSETDSEYAQSSRRAELSAAVSGTEE